MMEDDSLAVVMRLGDEPGDGVVVGIQGGDGGVRGDLEAARGLEWSCGRRPLWGFRKGTYCWCCVCFWSGESALRGGLSEWRRMIDLVVMASNEAAREVCEGVRDSEGLQLPLEFGGGINVGREAIYVALPASREAGTCTVEAQPQHHRGRLSQLTPPPPHRHSPPSPWPPKRPPRWMASFNPPPPLLQRQPTARRSPSGHGGEAAP